MSNLNGLLSPQATHGNPEVSYYLTTAPEQVLPQPTLISPIALENSDKSSIGYITVGTEAEGVYEGAVSIQPGPNSLNPVGNQVGMTIRATTLGVNVEVGDNAQTANLLYIAGPSGVGQVYDEKYNPPVNPTAVASSTGSLPITTIPRGFAFSYTPDKTGAYMLQVNVNIRNADSIPLDGFIEWVLSDGAEVQYASSTLNSNQLIKVVGMDEINGVPGGIPEPTDFTFSNLCVLTAGVPVSLSITTARNSTVGGLSWSIQNYDARLIQMC